jgi:hypothetical protein
MKKETGNLGVGTTAPRRLVEFKCVCGKKLTVHGEGWEVKINDAEFVCPCGGKFVLNKKTIASGDIFIPNKK